MFATFVEKKWLDLARGAEEGRRRQNKVLATQKEECADDGMIDDGGDGDLARGACEGGWKKNVVIKEEEEAAAAAAEEEEEEEC